jgi:hypothetical protein
LLKQKAPASVDDYGASNFPMHRRAHGYFPNQNDTAGSCAHSIPKKKWVFSRRSGVRRPDLTAERSAARTLAFF